MRENEARVLMSSFLQWFKWFRERERERNLFCQGTIFGGTAQLRRTNHKEPQQNEI